MGEPRNNEHSAATTIQTTINPHPTQAGWGNVLNTQSCGGHSTGETPSNIPNLEAKPGSADGTATDRLWESRTPPQHTLSRRASSKRMGSFAYQAQPFLAGRARSSEGITAPRHHRTCVPHNNAWPALLHSHDPRRLSYRPLPGPLHRRAHADRLCPCG